MYLQTFNSFHNLVHAFFNYSDLNNNDSLGRKIKYIVLLYLILANIFHLKKGTQYILRENRHLWEILKCIKNTIPSSPW